ncbi:zinc-binding dehydrogenase [Solirubrobacter sp. CPCC 204708]|uniref:Zinc-binding dehydrogenase n=1 Tax=Solirubrobacter deserti TaxID=2282478 RepID=A0ABT4RE38_9ACTN|nr:zinc-binding dehydrogenase [Solirubrobacter deserti]MBE2316041.1 zinc-binding dehydrogenase [Solirubrobacter deserti]MDA0136793.1 zinc-binding dehydrogenase [Solirubrobacter deserti]
MRAIEVTRFGPPEVLEPRQRPEPTPTEGEVLIEVELAEVLFLDTQLRAGWGRDFFAVEPPFVPGVGVAGTIDGRRVIAGTSRSGAYSGGGYAELAAAPADMVFDVPAGVRSADALAALHDGMMAFSRLGHTPVRPGDRALVTAAAGGIGVWLVPLLRAAGATVIAAARGAEKLELARSRGAHTTVDYSEPGWTDGLGELDIVFDGAGGDPGTAALAITASGGRFHAYGAASGDFPARRDDVEFFGIETPVDWRAATTRALHALAEREVEPVIGQSVPLEDAAAAHAAIADRSVLGKTLLEVR